MEDKPQWIDYDPKTRNMICRRCGKSEYISDAWNKWITPPAIKKFIYIHSKCNGIFEYEAKKYGKTRTY